MTREEFEVYLFDPKKYYIVLVNRNYINMEGLVNVDFPFPEELQMIFIPVNELDSMKLIAFESIQAIKDWVESLSSSQS